MEIAFRMVLSTTKPGNSFFINRPSLILISMLKRRNSYRILCCDGKRPTLRIGHELSEERFVHFKFYIYKLQNIKFR